MISQLWLAHRNCYLVLILKTCLGGHKFKSSYNTRVISKVLHTALAWPVGRCNLSDFRDSCEPDFSKEHCVGIRGLRGPCSAKRGLEMEEESDSGQISRSDQRPYIKIETLRGRTQLKFIMLYMKFAGIV